MTCLEFCVVTILSIPQKREQNRFLSTPKQKLDSTKVLFALQGHYKMSFSHLFTVSPIPLGFLIAGNSPLPQAADRRSGLLQVGGASGARGLNRCQHVFCPKKNIRLLWDSAQVVVDVRSFLIYSKRWFPFLSLGKAIQTIGRSCLWHSGSTSLVLRTGQSG